MDSTATTYQRAQRVCSISTRPILRIWDAFELLTDVRTLDLAWLSKFTVICSQVRTPTACSLRPPPYASRESCTITSQLRYSTTILRSSSVLTLTTYRKQGNVAIIFSINEPTTSQPMGRLLPKPVDVEPKDPSVRTLPPFRSCGPMQNLPGPFTDRCPNLRSLTLHKVGQKHRTEFTPDFDAKDIDIYNESATFIDSAKATVHHVVDHGERTDPRHPPPPGQKVVLGYRRPMDVRYMSILRSHLFHGHWACLETMIIWGVNRPPNWLFDDRYPPIRTARGDFIDPLSRERVGMMDHVGLGDPLAGVIR